MWALNQYSFSVLKFLSFNISLKFSKCLKTDGTVAELFPFPSAAALPVQCYALCKVTQTTDLVSRPPYFCHNSSYPTSPREKVMLYCFFPLSRFLVSYFPQLPSSSGSLTVFILFCQCYSGELRISATVKTQTS